MKMKIKNIKKWGLIFIISATILNYNLFALSTAETDTVKYTEKQKMEILEKWWDEAKHIIVTNALITPNVETYKYFFNKIMANNGVIPDYLRPQIAQNGGKFLKYARRCKIVEYHKENPKLVKIEYNLEYSNDVLDGYWTHIGSLVTVEKYKQKFL